MSNTPPGLIDATISGGFLSDHLDLDQKWWLVNRVMELIDSHSRSAPSCQKLMKPLLEEFFPGSKELPGTSSDHVNARKKSGISTTPQIRHRLLDELARFVTRDLPLERKALRIFQKSMEDLELSPNQQTKWMKKLGLHQLAGKPQIAVQTTHDYVKTELLDCTEDHALFHFHRPLVRGVFIMMELKKDCRTEEYHSPLHATVEKVTTNPLKKGEYLVKVEFQQMLEEKHGILERFKPTSQNTDRFLEYGDIPSPSRSLKLKLVGCPLCDETRLPFWSLKPGTVRESRNLFGLPVYGSPYPGYEECDFQRLRVTVCPRCFFASSRLKDFIIHSRSSYMNDRILMRRLWDSSCPELKKTLHELPSRFGTHTRTLEEAVLSFEIAIESLEKLLELKEDQEIVMELLTLGLLRINALEQLERSRDTREQKALCLKRIGDPLSGYGKENRIRVLFWKCMLELQTGGRKQASNSLRQLESLALGRETDLYTAKLLEECLIQARKALLRKDTPSQKTRI